MKKVVENHNLRIRVLYRPPDNLLEPQGFGRFFAALTLPYFVYLVHKFAVDGDIRAILCGAWLFALSEAQIPGSPCLPLLHRCDTLSKSFCDPPCRFRFPALFLVVGIYPERHFHGSVPSEVLDLFNVQPTFEQARDIGIQMPSVRRPKQTGQKHGAPGDPPARPGHHTRAESAIHAPWCQSLRKRTPCPLLHRRFPEEPQGLRELRLPLLRRP